MIGLATGVVVWNQRTSTEEFSIGREGLASRCIAVSPDKSRLVTVGEGIIVYDFRTRKVVHERRLDNRGGSVSAIAFSPDGKLLVASVTSGKGFPSYAIVWRTNDYSAEVTFPLHANVVRAMVFLPGTHKIITGSEDPTVCVWDLDKLSWAGSPPRERGRERGQAYVLYFTKQSTQRKPDPAALTLRHCGVTLRRTLRRAPPATDQTILGLCGQADSIFGLGTGGKNSTTGWSAGSSSVASQPGLLYDTSALPRSARGSDFNC